MITDFFLGIFINVAEWFLGLFGEFEGLSTEVTDAVGSFASFMGQTGAFLGAVDHWFPVGPTVALFAVAFTVEVTIGVVNGVRKIKQLLPFQ